MKVIDLLNKIANGEEVPRKIRYDGIDMFWCEPCKIHEVVDVKEGELCGKSLYNILDNLNDEVEIIEEDKKIEKIWFSLYEMERVNKEVLEKIENKINEIIDKLNEGE